MYSCDISCMIREMMEMEGLDSAKWQKSKRRDMDGISKILNDNKTKMPIVSSSPCIQKTKNVKEEGSDAVS